MRVVALLLLALVAAASADCIGAGFSTAYQLGTGITPVNVPASEVQVVAKLPVCKNAFPAVEGGFQTCCGADAFNAIKKLGEEYGLAFSQASENLDALKSYRNEFDKAADQMCEHVPQYCEQYKKLISAFKNFFKNLGGAYKKCATGYRDYLEGALCAACHPDFFPNIAVQEGATVTFTWAPTTCTDISNACTDMITVVVDFAKEVSEAFNLGSSLDILNGVDGSTLAEQIKNFLCFAQIRGVATIDFSGMGTFTTAFSSFDPSGLNPGRDVNELRDVTVNALRSMFAKPLSLRQGGLTNAYNGTYNPVTVGQSNNFVKGAASTVTISMAALLIALLGLFLF